ncbi:MAG: FAD-dependent thymidylate synthase [Candidatus Omnitrophota bacterium]
MEIKLAGYNVETEVLEQWIESSGTPSYPLTPETISAAYARISRSSKDVTSLRKEAREDVKTARKSNHRIIFDMSHHSVAEHAVFNFDIIGVSRLALEEIEKFRLVSYTEKSQRYVTLNGDYVLPSEIAETDSKSRDMFKEMVRVQNAFYNKSFTMLKDYLFDTYPELTKKKSDQNSLEGCAKEDARYILALATEGQVGMTINARNLEHLFRRFALSQREEVRKIGRTMYEQVKPITPSLLLFPTPSAFETDLTDSFKQHCSIYKTEGQVSREPTLLFHTENGDDIILASLLSISNGMDFSTAREIVSRMALTEKEAIFKELFQHMEFFDAPPREFELADITFQAVISASNFAQLKRHRMATVMAGDYNIAYGNVIPENIKTVGLENEFNRIISETNAVYKKLKEKYGLAADYMLTNSHCRQVIMKMNLREFYHFIRLRSDGHAQWDIRNLADTLLRKVKEVMPLSSMVLCGKSDFVTVFEQIYHRKPSFQI